MTIYFRLGVLTTSAMVLLSGLFAHSQTVGAILPDPSTRISQLADDTSLERSGMQPWHLHMQFQLYDLQGQPKEKGTVEEWWLTRQSRRIVIDSPSFKETRPYPEGKGQDVTREAYLVRRLIEQVVNPVPHLPYNQSFNVREVPASLGKNKFSCLHLDRKALTQGKPDTALGVQYCLEPGTDLLRTVFDDRIGLAIIRNGLGRFRETNIARDTTINYYGTVAISGHVDLLEAFDPASTAFPNQYTEPVELNSSLIQAKLIKQQLPSYPIMASANRVDGAVLLCAIISKQGTIKSLDVVATTNSLFSDAALAAVRKWVYEPFLRDGQPAEVETQMIVHFNLKH